MDDILIDAQTLATFSNLAPGQVDAFRNGVAPEFLPASDEFWGMQAIKPGAASAEFAWQSVQQGLQEAWAKQFPLDMSIQLISIVNKYSESERAFRQVPNMPNEEIAGMQFPAQEVWPFQRAVMFLTVNSWRARFCPRCGKRFVAAKPKSAYCSDACFSESRKGAKRAWWGEHGEEWRKQKTSKKQSKRGGK